MALPLYEDVLANAAPGSRGEHPADVGSDDHSSPADIHSGELASYGAQLDQLAAQAGGSAQRVVAQAKPNWVGWALGAYVAYRILK